MSDPAARQILAPKLAADDLPAVTPKLVEDVGLAVDTREEWQAGLFDGAGRFVIPTSDEGLRFNLLQKWALVVNPELDDHVGSLVLILIILDTANDEIARLVLEGE